MESVKYSVTKRYSTGSIYLIVRQIICQSLNFLTGIFLARCLAVEEYGFYGILFYLFSFLMNFGDIGLAASLIYKKDEPTEKEYSTIFTVQLLLSLIISLLFVSISPLFCKLYHLRSYYTQFFILIGISIFISSFRVVPTIKLERHLDFKWVSIIEIVQSVLFCSTAGLLAYFGWGAWSFTLALFVRVLSGSILVQFIKSAHFFKLSTEFLFLKEHIKFGIPYQSALFVNLLKDAISPVVIGLLLGISKTGIVNMSSTIAAFPVMFLFILNRIYLPSFSRAKENPSELQFLFKIAIRLSNGFTAPLAIYVLIMVDPIIVNVFGARWLESKVTFYYLWTSNLFLPSMLVCLGLLNAFGKTKTFLKFNLLWMAMTLGIGIPLIYYYGIIGFGITNLLVNISMVFVYIATKKYVKINFLKEHLLGWVTASITVFIPIAFLKYQKMNIIILIIGFLLYFTAHLILFILLSIKELKKTPQIIANNSFSQEHELSNVYSIDSR